MKDSAVPHLLLHTLLQRVLVKITETLFQKRLEFVTFNVVLNGVLNLGLNSMRIGL